MKGKRKLLAELFFKVGLTEKLSRLGVHRKVVIFNYHRLRPEAEASASPFDDLVFSTTVEQFVRQMKWLKQHTHLLSEQELIDLATTRRLQNTARPSVVITFDDGYYDNYALAYPVLKALQIPAFFFICTQMIEERKLYWWDILAYLLKKCRKPVFSLHGHKYELQKNYLKIIEDFQSRMKDYQGWQIEEEIRLISEETGVALPAEEMQDGELMRREHVYELAANQLTIGSHGHSHQALSCLDEREHERELRVSKQILEEMTGREVKSVSYPFGRYRYIPPSIQEIAGKCGYQLGFTSSFGVNYLNRINALALRRFSGELEQLSTVSLLAVWPELFASKESGF